MDAESRRVPVILLLNLFCLFTLCHGQVQNQYDAINNKLNPKHGPMMGKSDDGAMPVVPDAGLSGKPQGQTGHIPKDGTGPRKHRKFPQFKLSEVPQCKDDIHKFCNPKIVDNNFEVIDCLQGDPKIADDISVDCQHFLWNYKRNLTHDDRFEMVANDVCKKDLKEITDCGPGSNLPTGHVIPCMVDNIDQIKQHDCRRYIEKMSKIVFSDYRLIYKFADSCNEDIQKLSCGRLETQENEETVHRQGRTLECLVRNISKLSQQCKHQLLRVAELQADDYHLDRTLYYACREAREQFCAKTQAGHGKVYECLFKHKFDPAMPKECRDKLQRRQQEIAEDVKVEKKFYLACMKDIQKFDCMNIKTNHPDTRRAGVLVCLEGAMKDDEELSAECLSEMNEVRKQLLSDYKINPELIAHCENEIKSCIPENTDKLEEGQVMHCLMDMARMKKKKNSPDLKLSAQCMRAVEEVLMEADVGSNFQMDRVLAKACMPVVQTACKDLPPGDARVLNCLMEKIDDDDMTDDCEEKLMEIQYFVMRDWRLDANLYKHCHENAKKLCNAPEGWKDTTGASNWGLVMPCLYQHMKSDDPELQVSRACKHEVKRVMRNRARRIELDPEIEQNCVTDLGRFCSDQEQNHNRGDELTCLQDNYDDLTDACQEVVGNITADEDEFMDLDVVLVKACTPMLKMFCGEELENEEEEDVIMQCLIKHKHHNNMDPKCYAGIEHHQLISMKNYEFSHKFKEACKKAVKKYCPKVKKKSDVVSCLSEHVRNDTLLDTDHRIDKQCRKQLRFEVMQRGEDIELDKDLKRACKNDVDNYCSKVHHGNAKVVECLKAHQAKLQPRCHKLLFKREREEVKNNADFKLQQVCKVMIKQYCRGDEDDLVTCLVAHKHEPNFDAACRDLLTRRQVVRNRDYRLNPTLRKECGMDIKKFCQSVVARVHEDEDASGEVLVCLREQFNKQKLSNRCTDVVRDIIKESALNYMEDTALATACEDEIKKHCRAEHQKALELSPNPNEVVQMEQDPDKGEVQRCLMDKFKERLISGEKCKQNIARIIQESEIDISIDPILHTACQKDLYKFCADLAPGEGRKMTCLLQEFEDHPNRLDKKCYAQLKRRKELWELSVRIAPLEGFQELANQISGSPAKTYLLGVICSIIGVIFLIGITCGRVTKRVTKENKNK